MKSPHLFTSKPRRWAIAGAGVVVLLAASVWGMEPWISRKLESELGSRLHERGMEATWKKSSWGLLKGLELRDFQLRHTGEAEPMAELGNLHLDFPLRTFIGLGNGHKLWKTSDAAVTLRDEKGSIHLEHVTLRLESAPGRLDVRKFTAKSKGLAVDVAGGILVKHPARPGKPFTLHLDAVRGTLAALDVEPETGPFTVTGSFTVDARQPDVRWHAKLDGSGKDLVTKGLPCTRASAHGELSSADSTIRYELHSAHGSTRGNITKADWKPETPLIFKGSLLDASGTADDYQGNYRQRVFTVESLAGQADLWAIAGDFPAIADHRPENVSFKNFPRVEAKNCRRDANADKPVWTVGSLAARSDDGVQFEMDGREVEATHVSATGSYDGEDWEIEKSRANVLSGTIEIAGRYRDGVLRHGTVEIADFKVSDLRRLAGEDGKSKASGGIVSGKYRGTLDFRDKAMDGHGSLAMENAPVIEVPLLDQVYDLFAALIPGIERSGEGRFEADFKGGPEIVEVTRFQAEGGTLTVSAVGTVNLKKKRVDGTARGKLTGLPGLVTSPLSRLLEMEVSGPYDDIRVRPLGPAKLASSTVSGTVGDAVDTLEETGKITGTVIKEGVKLPFRWLREGKRGEKSNDR